VHCLAFYVGAFVKSLVVCAQGQASLQGTLGRTPMDATIAPTQAMGLTGGIGRCPSVAQNACPPKRNTDEEGLLNRSVKAVGLIPVLVLLLLDTCFADSSNDCLLPADNSPIINQESASAPASIHNIRFVLIVERNAFSIW